MAPRLQLAQIALYASLFLISAIPIAQEIFRRADIWWTPFAMRVPLAQSGDRVEIFVGDQPLQSLLDAGKLRLDERGSAKVLSAGDLGLRFNNRDRVRAARLPVLLLDAAICAMTLTLMLLMATGRIAYRGGPDGA
jgi:hypothetical protein